jgi:hypothetical protein
MDRGINKTGTTKSQKFIGELFSTDRPMALLFKILFDYSKRRIQFANKLIREITHSEEQNSGENGNGSEG